MGHGKREFEVWREELRERWRRVVVVGILKGGVRCGNGGKRVRFLDGMGGKGKDQVEVEYEEELGSKRSLGEVLERYSGCTGFMTHE
jgi:hypothetical protein